MNAVVESKGPREIDVVRGQFDKMGEEFKAVLPAHIPVERFARVVMTAIQNNQQLLQAPRKELFNACMKAAQDGLLPDGREGALVLRKSKNSFSITWQPMIAGVREEGSQQWRDFYLGRPRRLRERFLPVPVGRRAADQSHLRPQGGSR